MRMSKKTLLPKLRFPNFKTNWQITTFDKVFAFHQNNTFSRSEMNNEKGEVRNIHYGDILIKYGNVIYDSSDIPYINDEIDLTKYRDTSYLQNGDVIFADTAEDLTAGKAVEIQNVDGNILAGLHTMLCRPKNTTAPSFFGYYFNSPAFYNNIKPLLTGTKVFSISKSSIIKTQIATPEFTEQQKIVDCLSSLDNLIAAENKKLEALKTHKKGLMQKLFPAEGKTVPQRRFPEFRGSGKWGEITLKKLADFRRGSFPQPYGLPDWYDEEKGMPFIQVFDVGDDLRVKSKTKNKISALATKQSVFIPEGTVIITIQGSIGRVAITQYDAYIDRTLLLFEKFHRIINKIFIAYTLQMLFSVEKQKAPGGIIKTITKEVLSGFVVKIPDTKEQKKIANCLSSLDDKITAQAGKIETLKQHKKGLMQGLFPSAQEVFG
jgi:type I restriction enzyme S subunit